MSATDPTTAQLSNDLRNHIASRRDGLVGRQRRSYSIKRQHLIDQLGDDYRQVYQIQLNGEVA